MDKVVILGKFTDKLTFNTEDDFINYVDNICVNYGFTPESRLLQKQLNNETLLSGYRYSRKTDSAIYENTWRDFSSTLMNASNYTLLQVQMEKEINEFEDILKFMQKFKFPLDIRHLERKWRNHGKKNCIFAFVGILQEIDKIMINMKEIDGITTCIEEITEILNDVYMV